MANENKKPPKVTHFKVDNEPYTTEQDELTPDFIISEYGGKDPTQNYLVEIKGNKEVSYRDKGTIPILIKNGDRFQVVSLGPTPVSDPNQKFGAAAFVAGLTELGFQPAFHKESVDRVCFDYLVPTGRFVGRQVRLGFVVPPDFPMSPPTGPHVTPQIWPINTNADHPERAHESDFGAEWQYWSRPMPDWKANRSVGAYMAHVWRLWHTQ